jgi:phosphotriesterase-related protein
MESSTYKAAIIKYSTNFPELTEYEKKLGEAVAIAHKATGAPIYTHTSNKNGVAQIEFLKEQGVDLSRVIIGHMGDTDDLEYIKHVADTNVRIGMDRFALDTVAPELHLDSDSRARTVVDLWKGGYLDKMTLSHDSYCFIDIEGCQKVDDQWHVHRYSDLEYLDFQFSFIPQKMFPLFYKSGMTQREIDVMMIDTPRRIFEGK